MTATPTLPLKVTDAILPERWTVPQFHRLWETGYFDGRKAILLQGEILEMPIPGPLHNKGVGKVDYALKKVFTSNFWVRIQLPLELDLWSDPVPDVPVVVGSPDDHDVNPTTALLVVEVSDTTLSTDLNEKAKLYAAAGIQEYRVVDLNNRLLVVHRKPNDASSAGWDTIKPFGENEVIEPLALAGVSVAVADMLPRV